VPFLLCCISVFGLGLLWQRQRGFLTTYPVATCAIFYLSTRHPNDRIKEKRSVITIGAPPPDLEPISYPIPASGNIFLHFAGSVTDTLGGHINADNPITHLIQKTVMEGNLDGQVLTTICLLLLQDNLQTHQALNKIKDKLRAISSVQEVHTTNMYTMCQVASAAHRPTPGNNSGPKGPSKNTMLSALPRLRYSAVVRAPTPPGLPAPLFRKKLKKEGLRLPLPSHRLRQSVLDRSIPVSRRKGKARLRQSLQSTSSFLEQGEWTTPP